MRSPIRTCLISVLLALFMVGCSQAPSSSTSDESNTSAAPPTRTASFTTLQTSAVGETLIFSDGLEVRLAKIEDSRCAKDVQCVWAGELSVVLHLLGGAPGTADHELRLGTVQAREASVAHYKFALYDATTTSATLIVTKNSVHTETKDKMLHVVAPQPNQIITSPLAVTGEARGPWYFEASFPVKLLDANGNLLAETHAQAQGEWMTEDFVPFTATLKFRKPVTSTGTLVFTKDNPSGEPQHDDLRRIPVRFAAAMKVSIVGGVYGTVRIGPTCQVETSPPAPNCVDKHPAMNFAIASQSGERITGVRSGNDGRFWVSLPVGTYVIRMQNETVLPSMAPQAFVVDQNGYTELRLSLDSGIR